MNRQDAVWYYRLGGQTLGPVAWTDIEQLTRDTIDAQDLLIAQGGDEQWRSAAEVLETNPELAGEAEEPAAPAPEPAGDFEMPPDEPAQWEVLAEKPSPAAGDVLDRAVGVRDTGRAPAAVVQTPPMDAVSAGAYGAFTPEPGLGKWIGQAWEMVINEIWAWVGALLLMMLVSIVTLGIAGPPLTTGLYIMALKRYRGEQISPGDIFAGFSRFLDSWGLALVMMVPALLIMAPVMILFAIPAISASGGGNMEDIAVGIGMGAQFLMPVLWLLILGVQTIFFYSWILVADGRGAWESVTGSWDRVKRDFWSYLGIWLVLSILASAGSYACYIGWFVTYPLMPCAQVAAYMWHFRRIA